MSYKINPVTGNLDYYETPNAGGGANLAYTASPTTGVVASDTGTDATILAADATNAGLMLPAEKTKLAGIATGAEVNVNPDWNATTGDAQILNKPTIPSITGLATTSYVDTQDASKVDKVTGSRLITSVESTLIGNTSGTNTGDNAINTLYSGLAASKQDAITLTTTGTSGVATLSAGTLNIPEYSNGSGTVPQSIINSSLIFYANNC